MEITIQVVHQDGIDRVTYVGPINEESEVHLAQLLGQIGQKCVFNMKNVAYINSCGVRAWINFMREAQKNRSITLEECTPEVVMQINMIPNFKGSSKIESVFATFVCDDCGHSQDILFAAGKTLPTSAAAELPPVTCAKCQSTNTEMDELEEEYFAFVEAS